MILNCYGATIALSIILFVELPKLKFISKIQVKGKLVVTILNE